MNNQKEHNIYKKICFTVNFQSEGFKPNIGTKSILMIKSNKLKFKSSSEHKMDIQIIVKIVCTWSVRAVKIIKSRLKS